MNFRIVLLFVAAFALTHASAEACGPPGRKQVRVEGTITALRQGWIDVRTGRGTESLLITERTQILQGRVDVDASALRSGDRIVAQGVRLNSGKLEAREIRTADRMDQPPGNAGPAAGGHKH